MLSSKQNHFIGLMKHCCQRSIYRCFSIMQEVGRERAMFPGKWKLIGVSELVLSSAKCRSSTWSNKYTNETYSTFLFTDFFLSIPHEQVEGYTFCAIWVNSEFECRKKRASRTPHSDLRRGVRICQSSMWISSRVKKKRNCYGNYFNEKKRSVSGLHIILSRKLLMSQRGVNGSFDGKLCTSVEAYLWEVQSAFCGLSKFLSTSLWDGWQMSFSSSRWQESWNAQRLSACWTFIF